MKKFMFVVSNTCSKQRNEILNKPICSSSYLRANKELYLFTNGRLKNITLLFLRSSFWMASKEDHMESSWAFRIFSGVERMETKICRMVNHFINFFFFFLYNVAKAEREGGKPMQRNRKFLSTVLNIGKKRGEKQELPSQYVPQPIKAPRMACSSLFPVAPILPLLSSSIQQKNLLCCIKDHQFQQRNFKYDY